MKRQRVSAEIPIVDVSALTSGEGERGPSAEAIGHACREHGFFYVVGHGVDEGLRSRLEEKARLFFAQDLETKLAIRMQRGGRAWRGYFPVGAEQTSGRPDQKEGIYFGSELRGDHPKVAAGEPLYGRNLFPDIPGFRKTVLEFLAAMERLGHALMEGLALSLGLASTYFHDRYTADPLILFRLFHYPPLVEEPGGEPSWSVGEHTDYGVLTILGQDTAGGLEVRSRSGWIEAPPVPGSFVCNIGDMLEKMSGGRYRSTAHRVRNNSPNGRLSYPFFFDPNTDAKVRPIDPRADVIDERHERWDGASVHEFQGTYGDYLLGKVAKVFPALAREHLGGTDPASGG